MARIPRHMELTRMSEAALLDRMDIVDTCLAMHWHLDRKEWQALGDVFDDVVRWPTARNILSEDGSDAGGGHAERDREQVIESLRVLMEGIVTQHLVAGHRVVVLEGDRATCEAHSINAHIGTARFADSRLIHANLYRFDLRRTALGWRICGLDVEVVWGAGNEAIHMNVERQAQVLRDRG
jgi:hypothetical protein